jgi:hypothetical protein
MWLLQRHPFAVEARLERTTVLTYAAPASLLQALLPAPLALDSFEDSGFVAVALVQTRALRPRGLPAWLGQDFFLIGYRIFVRYTTPAGKRLRGLYILHSQTDRRMALLGNLMTSYRYARIDIGQNLRGPRTHIHSAAAGLDIVVERGVGEELPLPAGSPFASWQQARRFAGPLPFTFSVHPPGRVLIVEGVRETWRPEPVRVEAARVPLLAELGLGAARLASAFTIEDIPYHWKKGRVEPWKP